MVDQAMAKDSIELLQIAGGDPFILANDERDNICEMLDEFLAPLEDDD